MSWGNEELKDVAWGAVRKTNLVMRTLHSACCDAPFKPIPPGGLLPPGSEIMFVCVKCGKELDDECKDT
jgi:hypothetical protein